jgi:hypothetical protein
MKTYYFIPIFLFALSACKKSNLEKAPECIQQKIGEFEKNESTCSNGAKVDEYKFQGNIVYVFDPGLCGADLSSDVYNSNCEYFGFLGGIIGNDTINGESFSNHATYQETVWNN